MDLSTTELNKLIIELLVPTVKQNFGLILNEVQINQFSIYLSELNKWRNTLNLTAITEEKEIVGKHFLDSFNLFKVARLFPECRVMDIGTGAGFPGLPLKICYPEMKLTLVEAQVKKTVFLELLVNRLNLTQVEIINSRAELLVNNKMYVSQYDFTVARAVTNLNTLIKLCLPFLKSAGKLVIYTGKKIYDELNIISSLMVKYNGTIDSLLTLNTEFNGLLLSRTLLVISRALN